MKQEALPLTEGPFGFAWGPTNVVRLASPNGGAVIRIETDHGKRIDIHVSPTGRSIRVFRNSKELS